MPPPSVAPRQSAGPSAAPRVLVVSACFETHLGGIEIVAARLADELARLGLDVTWLASDVTVPAEHQDIRLATYMASNFTERRLGFPYVLPGPRGLMRIVREAQAADAVILHDSLYLPSVAALLAAKAAHKPILIVQHIGAVPYRSPVLRLLMRLGNAFVARPMLGRADQVVFISAFVRDFFQGVRFRRPSALIFNGVDTQVFRPAAAGERPALRSNLGLAEHPIALFVGRFVEKKGLHILRDAAAARPDVQWAFAGHGPIDPQSWGLANVKVFAGLSGESLARLYQASDILVLPSVGEGFPLVIQEALACGLPVICGAETTRADDAATHLLSGLDLGRPSNEIVQSLSRQLDALVQGAADRADRARFAGERYAWAATAARYRDLILSLAQCNEIRPPAALANPY
jgi:glycosyltransferase involved in cell wall biosynthesis